MGVAATDGDMDKILRLGSSKLVLVNRIQPNRVRRELRKSFIFIFPHLKLLVNSYLQKFAQLLFPGQKVLLSLDVAITTELAYL